MANTTVKSEQIEDGSITADKIADGAIVATELADNAVTTAKINADAVTGAKIADDAINSEHYTDGSIDTAHIADDQVTQAKIADDAVGADQLAASAVVTASIVDDNVTTAKIADGNISTALLADTAVTSAKLANNIDIAGTFDVTGATTLDSTLSVAGATTITVTDNSDALTLISTDTDANAGPYLNFYRNPSQAGADSDQLGQITFVGKNDAGTPEDIDFARIITQIKDATDGSEDGRLAINTVVGGSMYSRIDITEGETVINNESQDLDFRVESNDSANMLLVDGGNNKVLVEANNTASVTDSASMVAASAFEINGNAGEGSDILRFFAMADATGNYGIEVSNSGGNAQYDLCINPINKGAVIIGGTTLAAHGNTDDLQIGDNTGNRGIGIHSANDGTGAIFFADGDSSLSGQLEYSHASDHLAIITGGNQRLRIDAHGVKFGTDSAAANALDDYEEGTWNPLLIAGTTNPTGGGVAAQDGAYTKIGNRVFCTFYCGRSWTNSPAGAVYIMNLPFTVADDADNHLHFHCVTYNVDLNSGGGVFGAPVRDDTTCRFYHQGDGAWGALSWESHMTSTAYVSGVFSYFTT